MKTYTRRDFVALLTMPFLALGLGKLITACSGDSSSPQGDPDCLNAGTKASISSNHGHQLSVSKEDVAAAVQKSYDIKGHAGHSHQVTLTAGHFAELAANTSIQVTSTFTGHEHVVTVSCASV